MDLLRCRAPRATTGTAGDRAGSTRFFYRQFGMTVVSTDFAVLVTVTQILRHRSFYCDRSIATVLRRKR